MPSFDNASYIDRESYSATPPVRASVPQSRADYEARGRYAVNAPLARPMPLPPVYKLAVPGFNSFQPGPAIAPDKPPII